MVGKKKITSKRARGELNDLFRETYEVTVLTVKALKAKLKAGKYPNGEDLLFLRNAPKLFESYENREKDLKMKQK